MARKGRDHKAPLQRDDEARQQDARKQVGRHADSGSYLKISDPYYSSLVVAGRGTRPVLGIFLPQRKGRGRPLSLSAG